MTLVSPIRHPNGSIAAQPIFVSPTGSPITPGTNINTPTGVNAFMQSSNIDYNMMMKYAFTLFGFISVVKWEDSHISILLQKRQSFHSVSPQLPYISVSYHSMLRSNHSQWQVITKHIHRQPIQLRHLYLMQRQQLVITIRYSLTLSNLIQSHHLSLLVLDVVDWEFLICEGLRSFCLHHRLMYNFHRCLRLMLQVKQPFLYGDRYCFL